MGQEGKKGGRDTQWEVTMVTQQELVEQTEQENWEQGKGKSLSVYQFGGAVSTTQGKAALEDESQLFVEERPLLIWISSHDNNGRN